MEDFFQLNTWGYIPGILHICLSSKTRLWYVCGQHPLGSRVGETWLASENCLGCDLNSDLLRSTAGTSSYLLDFLLSGQQHPAKDNQLFNEMIHWYFVQHTHLASDWKEEIIYEAYRRSLAELELNTISTIKNMMSEHLGLSLSILTTGLISASLKVGENCSHKVCKRCNVIKSHQTY